MRRYLLLLLLIGVGFHPRCFAQASPYNLQVFKAQSFTATAQTGTVIQLNGLVVPSTIGSSFSSGAITVTGVGLTTASFQIMGSADNGATYYPLNVNSIATPTTLATTTTITANGLYQVNLAGLTHVKFVTTGTFTATSVSITLTASPNALTSRSGGGAAFPSTPSFVFATSPSVSRAATTSDLGTFLASLSGCSTAGFVYSPSSSNCVSPTGSGAALGTANIFTAQNNFGPSLLNAVGPAISAPGPNTMLARFNALASTNLPTTGPIEGIVIGDSIFTGQVGTTSTQFGPIQQMSAMLYAKYGYHGSGLIPYVEAMTAGLPVFGRGGWGLASGSTIASKGCDFGPSQTGVSAGCTVAVLTGTNQLNLENSQGSYWNSAGLIGDTVMVAGETNSSTTACTMTMDGSNVVTTSFGGTSGSPTPYVQSFKIPNSTPLQLHTQIAFTTTGGAGQCNIYGGGVYSRSRLGVEVTNLSVASALSDAFGTSPSTQLAWLPLLPTLPTFAIINLGANDIDQTGTPPHTPATYGANLQAIVTNLHTVNPVMSIFIVDQHQIVPTSTTITKAQVQQQEQLVAQSNPYTYYHSIADDFGTWVQANAAGLMAPDTIHDNNPGGAREGAIVYNWLTEAAPIVTPSIISANDVIVPTSYSTVGNSCSASGLTAGATITCTIAFTSAYLPASPTSTWDIGTCADAAYQAAGITFNTLNQYTGVVTYTSPGTPAGLTSSNCQMSLHALNLDASVNGGNDITFDVTYPNFGQPTGITSMSLYGTTPGQQVNLVLRCGNSGCVNWAVPSQFDNPARFPFSNPSNSPLMSVVMRTAVLSDPIGPLYLTSAALPASAIAANTCASVTATVTSAQTTAGHRLVPNTASGGGSTCAASRSNTTAFSSASIDFSTVDITSATVATVNVCNRTAASVTPSATTTFYLTCQ